MASANDNTTKSKGDLDKEPAIQGGADSMVNPIRDGLYMITNKMARTLLDTWDSKSGTECQGYTQNRNEWVGNQLWILRRSSGDDTYTLRSFRNSTFLDLASGNSDNGATVIGWNRVEESLNQQWRLQECAPRYYAIQCARTNTYLEIPGGNPARGTRVTCSGAAEEKDHQMWIFDRASVSGPEIQAILQRWRPEFASKLILPHRDAPQYFVLPSELRRSLWQQTGLHQQPVRPCLFDYDVFVIKTKDKVHSWARDAFPVEIRGFGVLFGIIYGDAKEELKAYNWYLTDDMCSLIFFDPLTGREYSAEGLNGSGFEPISATL